MCVKMLRNRKQGGFYHLEEGQALQLFEVVQLVSLASSSWFIFLTQQFATVQNKLYLVKIVVITTIFTKYNFFCTA